jgi:hypothetical protein
MGVHGASLSSILLLCDAYRAHSEQTLMLEKVGEQIGQETRNPSE